MPTRSLVLALTLIASATAAQENVVATVDGKPITAAETEEAVAPQLIPLRQQEYEIRLAAAKAVAVERLEAEEAKKRGITVEELRTAEITKKAATVDEKDVESLATTHAARLPSDPKQARDIVRDSLRQQKLDERRQAFHRELLAKGKFAMKLPPPRVTVPFGLKDPSRGTASAPVTIVEYSDFECPYCASAQPALNALLKEYEGRVRLVFKQFPLENIHPHARGAAEASLCAADQNKFWPLHDWMFQNTRNLSKEAIIGAAVSLNIDAAALQKCMEERRHSNDVERDVEGGNRIGVGGTPTFYVNGRAVNPPSMEMFREIIDDELARVAK